MTRIILILLLVLCMALCIGQLFYSIHSLQGEIKHLQARDSIRSKQMRALEGHIALNTLKIDKVVPGVREIMEGKQFIPVWDCRSFLVLDERTGKVKE